MTDTIRQYVGFELAGEHIAFPMERVLEIVRVPSTVDVPMTHPALIGLANLRGVVLPVIDLRQLLDLPPTERADSQRVVVCDAGSRFGLCVDRVSRVMSVEKSDIDESASTTSLVSADLLLGVVKNDDDTITQLVDPAGVVGAAFQGLSTDAVVRSRAANVSIDAETADEPPTLHVVSFEIDGEAYALDIEDVREIVRVPDKVSQVVGNGVVQALFTLRGMVTPLVSLRSLFHLPPAPPSDQQRVLVLQLKHGALAGASVGLSVDRVAQVFQLPEDAIEPPPALLQARADITGIIRVEESNQLISVLRASSLLDDHNIEAAVKEARKEDEVRTEETAEGLQGDEIQLVVFSLGEEAFGVPIESVREITRVSGVINQVPRTPEFIEGLVNLRGSVLPVIDMRGRFHLAKTERSDRQRILVLELSGIVTGFVVDAVTEVLRIPPPLPRDLARALRGSAPNAGTRRKHGTGPRTHPGPRCSRPHGQGRARAARGATLMAAIKVLVVDDSALMRRTISGMMTDAGFDVETARDGLDALERIVEYDPDVVTMDINMPVMDGLTCLAEVMANHPRPVIMVSSLHREGRHGDPGGAQPRCYRLRRQARRQYQPGHYTRRERAGGQSSRRWSVPHENRRTALRLPSQRPRRQPLRPT